MPAKLQDQEPRWDDVRILLAAHRLKSLGAAATRLGLNASTVGRRLSTLEASLGVRLFERTRDGLVATRAAEHLLMAAEAVETAHSQLTREASDVESRAEGVVRLTVAPGEALAFVAPALVRLRAKHPKIHLELDASAQTRNLTRHEADIALRSVRPAGAELVMTKIVTARWIPAGAPTLVRRLKRVTSWSDAPWITWDRDYAGFPPALWVAQHARSAEIVLRTSDFSTQLAAVGTGLGIALVPAPYLHVLGLRAVQHSKALAATADACPSNDLWLISHRVLREVPRVAAVWTFLAAELRSVMRRGGARQA